MPITNKTFQKSHRFSEVNDSTIQLAMIVVSSRLQKARRSPIRLFDSKFELRLAQNLAGLCAQHSERWNLPAGP
ncbi:MAG TPA: hypothetical protein VK582_01460 [Pyrinomonadaceae bacterium]|nr:hypothetical protein [Pyrinomonadaceae bacterium]